MDRQPTKIFNLIFMGVLLGVWLGVDSYNVNSAPEVPQTVKVTAAGVPKYWGELPNYDQWFADLSAAGITTFLPFSEYQEIPEALYLGYEVDFFPPCSYSDPAFQALRTHNIKLLVAGQVLYAEGIPPLEADPLRALITCVGEGNISAVLSVDEPAMHSTGDTDLTQNVRALYERVKVVGPLLPVMMVHAPIPVEMNDPDGTVRPTTQAEVDAYLSNVEALSQYADLIGFDLYPIPASVASLIGPDLGVNRVDYTQAFPAYAGWLENIADGRPTFLVLQAFSYARQLSPELAREASEAGYDIPFPTEGELQGMACLAIENGVDEIAWWGQSFLLEADRPFWELVLSVTERITTDATAYCSQR